ncbi:hypothetical protein [Pseudobacteriovorax antillogorgiicola]|uniref:Outer membrane protein beta-barrel domain-containing protein n=1 Tax=Pseudobacteriovorax antillogorgiicola TaxID=1513793 RepID=A0A1Y6C1J9_9BACT|nr:hypothetical protein [Pseudobacteriovorax antillogorgiicola]TCS50715.1 hypothetical protein EDD56_11298 [Pseudobacteriovorax antillogorgiicola]SMF40655.1 hypothetical protein SAMN06296036_11297 [Pseudobacteriovorax antillogorgiicola]
MRMLRGLAVVSALVMSSQSYGLIEGQILVGQRSASIDFSDTSYDFSGTETKMSVYLDPIPLVPVGFGLTMANVDLGEDGLVSGLKGSEISVDVTAWLPIGIAGLKPYAKLAYVVSGEYTRTLASVDTDLDASGTKLAAGLKYSPIPLVGLMLEVEKSTIELEADGISESSDNLGILLGVGVGI